MTNPVPPTYKGKALPPSVESLLNVLVRYGFGTDASAAFAGKTINILFNDARCGYINPTVLGYKGVIGYHFAAWGRPHNDCASEHRETLAQEFCRRYGCSANDVLVQTGTGSNAGRRYLIILNPTVALQVLLTDASLPFGGDVYLVPEWKQRNIREISMV